jgi:hypothetical protein
MRTIKTGLIVTFLFACAALGMQNCTCSVKRTCKIQCKNGNGAIECDGGKKCTCSCKAGGDPDCRCIDDMAPPKRGRRSPEDGR